MTRQRLSVLVTTTTLIAAWLILPAATLASSLPPECSQVETTVTCSYTSGDNLFTVPSGVTTVHVVAVGGHGSGSNGAVGGAGARVSSDLGVSPGSTLHAVVASGGGSGGVSDVGYSWGGAGGGASDVRTGPGLETRVLVAAGGGGAGYWTAFGSRPDGGAAGQAGSPAAPSLHNGGGGGAGCLSSVDTNCGAGGLAPQFLGTVWGVAGSDGALGVGGAGAADSVNGALGGGGGGGGLYGGGGGAAGHFDGYTYGNGGGGGGGSSLVPTGGTFALDDTFTPSIEISYLAPDTSGFNVVSAASTSMTSMTVTFDAVPDAVQATTLANYSVPGLTLSGTPSLLGTTATITTTAQAAQTYTVTVSNVTRASDASPLVTNSATFTGTAPPAPQADISPVSIDFGSVDVGTTSTHQAVTVTNNAASAQTLNVSAATISGANTADFTFAADHCTTAGPIAAGSSCTIELTFTPSATGARSATLSITDDAADSPQTVALSGTGTTPATPSADVRLTMTGAASAPKGAQVTYVITVSNIGPSTAHHVVLTNPVPSGGQLLGITTSQGTCAKPAKGTVSCSLGDLASGGSAGSVVTIKIMAKAGSTLTDLASAYSTADAAGPATPDPDTSNNWATFTTSVRR